MARKGAAGRRKGGPRWLVIIRCANFDRLIYFWSRSEANDYMRDHGGNLYRLTGAGSGHLYIRAP
jgi:hypothetical protein